MKKTEDLYDDYLIDKPWLTKDKAMFKFIQDIQNDALEEALKCCKGVHRSNVADLLIEDKIKKLINKNNGKK